MSEEILLTKEGYEKIVAEHEELVSVRRQEVAERIKEAISYGDISENAEYDSAKNEQAELEERIIKLENMIRLAKIIDEEDVSDEKVNFGLKVRVKDLKTKDVDEFIIVGATEADPFEGKISNESPIGKALLGRKKGETAEVIVPDGVLKFKIMSINKADENNKDAKSAKENDAASAAKEEKAPKKAGTKPDETGKAS